MQSAAFRHHFPSPPRLAAPAALAAIALIALTGCGSQPPAPQDTLFHAVVAPPYRSLDPATERSDGVNVLRNVYETLTIYDDRDGKVKPCLAESWTCNATRTEWTFTLRRDVLFHDGSQLTAAAVKKSIDRVMFLGKGASYIWDCVSSIEARTANTVVFRLNYAAPLPLIASSGCAAYIISPAAASKDEAWFAEGNDAGSGPYRIAAASSTSVALEAFDGYRDGWAREKYKKVYIAEIPSRERRMEYMRSGAADIVSFPDMTEAGELDGYSLRTEPSWESCVMLFNLEKEPCSSEDFRKALAYAFPYEKAGGKVQDGQAEAARGTAQPGLWGYRNDLPGHDDGPPGYACDLDLAREYLGRTAFEGVFLTLSYQSGRSELGELLELYRQNLETIGVNLIVMEADLKAQRKASDPDDWEDILLATCWPDYADPAGLFRTLPPAPGQDGEYGSILDDPKISLAVQKASILTMDDSEEAAEIYRNLLQKIFDQCPLVFLYNSAIPVAYRKGITGLQLAPAYASSVSYYGLRH